MGIHHQVNVYECDWRDCTQSVIASEYTGLPSGWGWFTLSLTEYDSGDGDNERVLCAQHTNSVTNWFGMGE